MLVSLRGHFSSLETAFLQEDWLVAYMYTHTYISVHSCFTSKSMISRIWVCLKQAVISHFDLTCRLPFTPIVSITCGKRKLAKGRKRHKGRGGGCGELLKRQMRRKRNCLATGRREAPATAFVCFCLLHTCVITSVSPQFIQMCVCAVVPFLMTSGKLVNVYVYK